MRRRGEFPLWPSKHDALCLGFVTGKRASVWSSCLSNGHLFLILSISAFPGRTGCQARRG